MTGRPVPIAVVAEGAKASPGGKTQGLASLPPLSLYVHLPWCLKKCPYCDFNSHEWLGGQRAPDAVLQERYRRALMLDLEAALPQVWGRTVHSIFMGGGTPSLFDPEQIEALLGDIRARLRLEPGCEITMEANPGTFESQRFAAYARAGVTRLSLGVQSFDDGALRALGRVHDGRQALAALDEVAASFPTWNLDLMYALPGQTLKGLDRDLQVALSGPPPHLSVYHLTIEPNTRFATRPPPGLPDDDLAAEMLDLIIAQTQAAGLARYEVSAFAQPGQRCAHNLNYWRFGDYLGIGAGAHAKLSFPDRIVRQVRWREPETYMQAAEAGRAASNEHSIEARDRPFEFMLNGLRLVEGQTLSAFEERTGVSAQALEPALRRAEQRGLLERDGGRVWATARGLDFLSDLQALFLPG